jgi:ferritin-like metal-binding protein YciE
MPTVDTLHALLVEEMRDLLDAERQITKALPRMAKKASSEEVEAAFREHLEVTQEQIERLTRAFEELGEPARAKKCKGMQGLIEEAQDDMKEIEDEDVLDAALIAHAQKVEHYEMAGYGTARTHAQRLGLEEVARLLEQTLQEEKQTDLKLTELAESMVNPQAAHGGGEEEEEHERPARRGSGSAGGSRARRTTATRSSSGKSTRPASRSTTRGRARR